LFRNFTVRGGASAATAADNISITVSAAGNDKPTAAQSALNWRLHDRQERDHDIGQDSEA
jgi:hypothetical protein